MLVLCQKLPILLHVYDRQNFLSDYCRFGVSEMLYAILVLQNPAFGISGEGRPLYYIIKLNYRYYLHTLSFCIHFRFP